MDDKNSSELTEGFKTVFRRHPAGVAVVTADAGSGPVAMTVTSVVSISADPPMLVFSVSEHSSSTATLRQADTVVVHFLGASQLAIAKLGATSGIDRFADTSLWTRLPSGEPYFPEVDAWFRARVEQQMEAGGSAVLLLRVLDLVDSGGQGDSGEPPEPLVYHDRTWHRLGEASLIDD